VSLDSHVVDILLIALVLRQLRARPLTPRPALFPDFLIAWAWVSFFQSFSPNGADLTLIAVFVGGAVAGITSGLSTHLWVREGQLAYQTGVLAAVVRVVGMGFLLILENWSYSSGDTRWIVQFSVAHDISTADAWVSDLLLMAVAQVVTGVGLLQWRRYRFEREPSSFAPVRPDLEVD
jgi:hypothetical protein